MVPVRDLDKLVISDPPMPSGSINWFAKLVRRLAPRLVVELGTGCGVSANNIAEGLLSGSTLATISWQDIGENAKADSLLKPWIAIQRVSHIIGDTRRMAYLFEDDSIDLLYVDSTHDYATISVEWENYRQKMVDGAIVVVDDIHFPGSDMERFWDPLPYDKVEIWGDCAGMFRYRRSGGG